MVICEPTVRPMAFLWHPAIKAFVSPFTSEGGRLKFKSRVKDGLAACRRVNAMASLYAGISATGFSKFHHFAQILYLIAVQKRV
jgi:hypothetical protein